MLTPWGPTWRGWPTPLYAQVYLGASAFPIPASQVLDMEGFTTHPSAKSIAIKRVHQTRARMLSGAEPALS